MSNDVGMIDTCRARDAGADDLMMLLAWRNHPSVRSFMLTQHEISKEEHFAWFAKVSQDATRRLLIIEEHEEPFGYVQFNNVAVGAISNWGFYVRPHSPKGCGRKLGITALNHAFRTLQLHKVCGQAISSNEASIALHQKLGFVAEGVWPDHQLIDGVYRSLLCFGLLKDSWSIKLKEFWEAK